MARARTAKELLDQTTKAAELLAAEAHTAEAAERLSDELEAADWESWPKPSEPGESPVFYDSELIEELKKPRPAPADSNLADRQPAVLEASAPAAPRFESLAGQLLATAAPAVGVLTATAPALSTAVSEYCGSGAGDSGRVFQRGQVVSIDRQANGAWIAANDLAGQRVQARQMLQPPMGANARGDTLRWLGTTVGGWHQGGLPLLVIVAADTGLELDELAPIARDHACIVALATMEDGPASWEPQPVAPRLAPSLPAEPAPTQKPKPPRARGDGWLAGVADLVADHPESVPGPSGEPMSVSYGRFDWQGRPYVALTGYVEQKGLQRASEIEIAPGVVAEVAKLRFYV